MHRLARTVRLTINPPRPPGPGGPDAGGSPGAASNAFAGAPTMRGLGRFYEIEVVCTGEPDAQTGYLLDIKEIDGMVRAHVAPIIEGACATRAWTDAAELMPALWAGASGRLRAPLACLRWRLTPTYAVEMHAIDQGGARRPGEGSGVVVLRQQFDFAAAHRLHVPGVSEEQNRTLFGRCNNPAGHGHNYRLEVAVAMEVAPGAPPALSLAEIERLTTESVVDRFDHKHLNVDTAEFAPGSGVIPSVERIAEVAYGLLAPRVAEASRGRAALREITVWETDRTSSTYPG